MNDTPPSPAAASGKTPARSFRILPLLGGLALGAVVLVALLAVAAFAAVTFAGPGFVAQTLANKTGFGVRYDRFSIDLLRGRVELGNFEISNPADFGGGTFLKAPTAVFEADLATLPGAHPHIRELSLHLSEVSIVTNKARQTNADLFSKRLNAATQPASDSAAAPSPAKPAASPTIDHLRLRLDSLTLTNLATTPAKTSSLNLAFDFERHNVTDLEALKQELGQEALSAGLRVLGPAALRSLTQTALGGATEAFDFTSKGLKTGTTEAAQTAEKTAKKITNAAKSLKGLFEKLKE